MENYLSVCSNINFKRNLHKLLQLDLNIILIFLLLHHISDTILSGRLSFCGRVLVPVACVSRRGKAADEIRVTFLQILQYNLKKMNELVVTAKILTDNFAGMVTSGRGPDGARTTS